MRSLWQIATGIGLTAVLLPQSGFAGAKLIHKWADPDAAKYRFSKTLAVAFVPKGDMRQVAEEAMVRNIKRVKAYPSYVVLQEGDLRDVESAKRKLSEAGYDSAVVLRPFNMENRVNYVPPAYPSAYYSFWGYYGYAWPAVYSPGYIQNELVVQVETILFSITDDKILWSGLVQLSNPESLSKLVDDIAKTVQKELKKKGIVK